MGLNTVYTRNPAGASAALYDHTRVERAPDAGGAPGAFAEIANVLIDNTNEFTAYLDTGGDPTSWYRYRWANTLGTLFSDYDGSGTQVGTNKVKTWAKRNMPDADLLDPFWDQWIEEILIDCYSKGIWREDYTDIVPTMTTPGVVDTTYGIPSKLRDIIRVEALSTATGSPHVMDLSPDEYWVRDRSISILSASTGYKYRVWGKARFNAIGEMTDDFFELLHEMLRVKYFDFRANGRGNYRAYIILDRNADVSPEQLMKFADRAQRNVDRAVAALSLGEPAIPVPQGGYA